MLLSWLKRSKIKEHQEELEQAKKAKAKQDERAAAALIRVHNLIQDIKRVE
jgi:hypothetical protein